MVRKTANYSNRTDIIDCRENSNDMGGGEEAGKISATS